MVRKAILCIIMTIIASLAFLGTVSSRGPETNTVAVDTIKSEVASSLDLGNSNVEQTAVTIAKDYPGEYNINQMSEIFRTLRKGWFYFSDPSYKNMYKHANRTLQDGKMSNTIGMGNCDDFAILMASLIVSLGGSTRITFASNATSPQGHAYCEVFLGRKGDSRVGELINWTRAEYNQTEIPGLNRTDNEVWMNLDWWADHPGGPNFKGDERMVVWQSDKLIFPKIVPVIDTMDSTAGWETLKDDKGSNISISSYPARKGLGIGISYDLKEGGWVGISRNVDPEVLSQVEGLNFSVLAPDKQNTIELRLDYVNGTKFGYSWRPDLGKWVYLQALYEDFKCLGSGNNSPSPNNKLDPKNVEKMEFIISSQPGEQAGSGKIVLDHIQGVMNIPAGSPWARAEERRKEALAKDLVIQSETIRDHPGGLVKSVLLAIESLEAYKTVEGDQALRRGLKLLPKRIAEMKHNSFAKYASFSPDGSRLATASWDNTARIWDASTGKELLRIEHSAPVSIASFSPDGRQLATASDDYTVRTFDAYSGKELAIMKHESFVSDLTFSPDGTCLATCSWDGTARIWDVATGRELARMNPKEPIEAVAFSPDGRYLATASTFEAIIWDSKTSNELVKMEPNGSVKAITFSPDGSLIATGGVDNTARIWNALTGKELFRLYHDESVSATTFSPDGRLLATASDDNTARIWEVATGKELVRIKNNDDVTSSSYGKTYGIVSPNSARIKSIIFSNDGLRLATASDDNTAHIWDTSTGQELVRIEHGGPVNCVAFSPDGRRLATASDDCTACLWDAAIETEPLRIPHNTSISAVTFSPDGRFLATASIDNTVHIWDARTGAQLERMKHDSIVDAIEFSPDGKKIATSSGDTTARIWDFGTGKELIRLKHDNTVNAVAFSPDGSKVATASSDTTARIWNAMTGEELIRLKHNYRVNAIVFSPDGTKVATASSDTTARIWNASTGRELLQMKQNGSVEAVHFSPEGTRLLILGQDKVSIWNIMTGNEVARVEPAAYIEFAAYSPDGSQFVKGIIDNRNPPKDSISVKGLLRMYHDSLIADAAFGKSGTELATASADKTARIWDLTNGRELIRMEHDGSVTSVRFNHDGSLLATTSLGNIARVWDASTGRELARLEHAAPVISEAFSPDGSQMVTICGDNTANIWSLDAKILIEKACSRLYRNFEQKDWKIYMAGEPYRETCPFKENCTA